YLIVVPSLEGRLVHSRLSQLVRAADGLARELPSDRARWPDFLDTASESANARVVVYDHLAPPSALLVVGDSRGARSTDVEDDGVASRAAASRQAVSGTVVHNGARFAEAAAPLHEALASVRFVRERLALAGAIALASALALGYVGAWLFARRLRRLEAAA